MQVVLGGGGSADLVVRAEVLPVEGQHLEVLLNGRSVASEDVTPGELNLRVPVPPSASVRQIELRWARATAIGPNDPRQAAALLKFLDVTPVRASAPFRPPVALRIPSGLAMPGLDFSGIYRDGWVEGDARLVLAGGAAGALVVRAEVLRTAERQRLDVIVGGRSLEVMDVEAGALDVRVPVPATDGNRCIELRWAATTPISPSDSRHAAARLVFIGISSGRIPTELRRFPHDLEGPELEQSGIYADGWMDKNAHVILAGGPAAELVLRAQVPRGTVGQHVDVIVDEQTVASRRVHAATIELRVAVPPSDEKRRIDLRWRCTSPIGLNDPREAAALLELLALVPRAPQPEDDRP